MTDWSGSLPFNQYAILNVPENSGVYRFTKNGLTVYVGETGNLRRRFREYILGENPCVSKHATHFQYKLIPHPGQRKKEEEFLIGLLQPHCNVQHR